MIKKTHLPLALLKMLYYALSALTQETIKKVNFYPLICGLLKDIIPISFVSYVDFVSRK